MSVAKRFDTFLSNIALTQNQIDDGKSRKKSVIKALNSHYWGSISDSENSQYVGSWGKYTRIRPPRDVDVLFTLPRSVYDRFQSRTGNKQSQLLQEVKGVLQSSFPSTAIKGDGPVVQVPFSAYDVELIPAFSLTSGRYWICMTDGGGYYKEADYDAEAEKIKTSNGKSANMTRHLIRMMKRWQSYCSVPLKSFWIELLAVDFLANWEHRGKSSIYYDYMVRDFLAFIKDKGNTSVFAPGTYEIMNLGDAWVSKAKTAHSNAVNACSLESSDSAGAGDYWQKIFGTDIPKYV